MAPSHYLNQCWDIVNSVLGNKLQWNFNHKSNIFIKENASENVVCEMASTLPQPQCVNPFHAEVNPWCIELFSVNMDKYLHFIAIITQGQFWPLNIVVAWVWVCVCLCLSVCVCVNHELVRMIIHDSFKLGSPTLDQRCKPPWLWSLLFCGAIDLDPQGQI